MPFDLEYPIIKKSEKFIFTPLNSYIFNFIDFHSPWDIPWESFKNKIAHILSRRDRGGRGGDGKIKIVFNPAKKRNFVE